ncbi:MAG: DUF2851 family protein [Polaribacter sp.]|nr:DUF2851 family protein [Polaribacter sp.]
MREDFLHYVWSYKLFSMLDLQTFNNNRLKVLKSGAHNLNSGPDFLNATIVIDNLIWVGAVEIHVKSSDWYLHNHEIDDNYDMVILHVVWEHDTEIFDPNNQPIPTLELKGLIAEELLHRYQNLISKELRWIPCEKLIATTDPFVLSNWLERLYFERLEHKSSLIDELLIATKNDYEAVLFQLLAKNFGLKNNGEAFLRLAQSFRFSILRKERFDVLNLQALLFGQAGFLLDKIEDPYYKRLQETYAYLQVKYRLKPMRNNRFEFFRMRPTNFPTLRIAQLGAMYHTHQQLFSELMSFVTKEEYYQFFTMRLPDFWNTHYTFQKTSPKRIKKITKSFVDLLLINTIIPLKFNYLKSRGEVDTTVFLDLIQQLRPEKNTIISKFTTLSIPSKSAFDTQALLELKNKYCDRKKCLHCAIGNSLLRKSNFKA